MCLLLVILLVLQVVYCELRLLVVIMLFVVWVVLLVWLDVVCVCGLVVLLSGD